MESNSKIRIKKELPKDYIPSVKDAEWFINYWKELPSYSNQEKALDKLFMDICSSRRDRYLGMTAAIPQVPVPTAIVLTRIFAGYILPVCFLLCVR